MTKDLGFEQILGDDTNALAKHLIEDVILPDLIIKTPEEAGVKDLIGQVGAAYPNGIVMPGRVWYAHHGSAPVFEWSHKCDGPGPCGGPLRPDLAAMWEQVLKRKACAGTWKCSHAVAWGKYQNVHDRFGRAVGEL